LPKSPPTHTPTTNQPEKIMSHKAATQPTPKKPARKTPEKKDAWDKQMTRDSKAGRLDFLAAEIPLATPMPSAVKRKRGPQPGTGGAPAKQPALRHTERYTAYLLPGQTAVLDSLRSPGQSRADFLASLTRRTS
jgi:hypothetical protein